MSVDEREVDIGDSGGGDEGHSEGERKVVDPGNYYI